MRSSALLVLAAAACGAAQPVATPPPALDCSRPSRACALRDLAAATPDLGAYARTAYGDWGLAAYAQLADRHFEMLVVDPGVMLHLDAFLAFGPATPPHHGDPWLVREQFATSLGRHRIYRGIAVDDATDAEIRAGGILAPAVRAHATPPTSHFIDLVLAHVDGSIQGDDLLMSVSDDPLVAKCVAHHYARDGKYVVVYTIDAPALDVLALDGRAAMCPPQPPDGSVDCQHGMARPMSDPMRGVGCRALYAPAVESFVTHRIDPTEIVASVRPADFADCDGVMEQTARDFHARITPARAACKPEAFFDVPASVPTVEATPPTVSSPPPRR